jgi:hypothetical protein
MRDYVCELAAISEDADKEIVLASFGAGEQALATCLKSPKSDPIVPGQFRPRRPTFIPVQDDRIIRRPFHRGLPASRFENQSQAILALGDSRQAQGLGVPNTVDRHSDRSADLEVLGRFLAPIAHDFILNDLPLVEGTQSGALDRGNVDEHVLAAALRLNESVPFGRIEPLHRSFSHLRLLAGAR